ncbi:MAG TPA: YIP1 family protein [Arachidicoccus sp.]|nr:YIP1 family protein [Arachidicoccus sp.]
METNANTETSKSKEAVKQFLSKGFGPLIKKVLCRPLDLNQEFKEDDTKVKSVVMILIAGILFIFLPYLFVGESRKFLGFRFFLGIGVMVVLALVFIGVLTWSIKQLYHKKVDFQQELFTGALCAIPLIILLVLICIINLFTDHNAFAGMNMFFGGGIGTLFNVYGFFLMITICFQSLRSVYIKANTAWYLSPAIVLLSFYLAIKIVQLV